MTTSTLISRRLCVAAALGCDAQALGQNTGRIQGTVTEDGGQPIAGAAVALHRSPRYAASNHPGAGYSHRQQQRVPGDPDVDVTTASNPAGAFAFDGLPPGLYTLCAAVPQRGYLPTCDWWRPVTLGLAAGETQTGMQIRVARGANLRVRVNDHGALLSSADTVASIHLVIGAGTASGEFHNAPIAGKDSAGRDHSITVPFDTPLFVWVASRDFVVADEAGHGLAELGSATYFTIPVGTPSRTFTFNITGRKK